MSGKARSLLLVSYFFPPMGLGGVQRASKTAKYLARSGWDVTVLACACKPSPLNDQSLLEELPSEVEIIRISDPLRRFISGIPQDGFAIKTRSDFFRRMIRVPDSRLFWSTKAQSAARDIVRLKNINYVLTTSPPPSAHAVGLYLKQRRPVIWLADFRDPWFADDLPPLTFIHKAIRNRLEKKIILSADLVTAVTAAHLTDLRERYPQEQGRFSLIPNGFDPEDFEAIVETSPERLILCHCGRLSLGCGVEDFFDVLMRLIGDKDLLREKIEFLQIGAVDEKMRRILLEKYAPLIKLDFRGYLPHKEALKELARSSTVVVFGTPVIGREMNLPAKLYEGLYFDKPLLAVMRTRGEAEAVLQGLPGVYLLNQNDSSAIKLQLQKFLASWQTGSVKGISRKNQLEKYSRKYQASAIADLLEMAGSGK